MPDPFDAALSGEPELLEALETYRRDAEGDPTQAELVRRIVRDWLATNGYMASVSTGGLRPDQLTTENDG